MDKADWQAKGAGHRQRLRDKFQVQGIDAFSDAEVVEMLLAMGTPRVDCKDAARAALAHFGTLPRVLEASAAELSQIAGLGPKNIVALQFVHGVARRFLAERLRRKDYLRSSQAVADYLRHSMGNLKREVFTVIFLDAEYAIIDAKVLSEGTLTMNSIYPREVIKAAFDLHAAALVIAHNHPSGNLQPSTEDRALTRRLFFACAVVDIKLLDHLIVGSDSRPFSFADHGLMAEIQTECLETIR